MLFLLAMAVAAPEAEAPTEPMRVAFVIDRSRSMGAEGLAAQRALLAALHEAHPDATWAVMGADAAALWLVEPYVDEPTLPADVPLRHGSEIPAAIALARVHETPPTHVVAVTDGRFSQRLAPKPPPAEGAPVELVVWTDQGVTPAVAASYAPGGEVFVSSDPAGLVGSLLGGDAVPSAEMPVTEDVAVPTSVQDELVAAVHSVVDGCLKKPKHRDRLGRITVETTKDEFVYMDLSRIDDAYRWCLSDALFTLDLPASLRVAPSLTVEVDLRTPGATP